MDPEQPAPASPLGNAIPALDTDPVYPSFQHHPMHHITNRPPPNPNICPKGEDTTRHVMKEKSGGYIKK